MRKEKIDNPRFPHLIKIIRRVDFVESNNPYDRAEGGKTEVVIYEGCGRAYTDTTTDGDNKVDTNKRKASIPMRYDEWKAGMAVDDEGFGILVRNDEPMWPMDGDIIETVKGNVIESGRVKDFEPDNDRSVIYWELNRNLI